MIDPPDFTKVFYNLSSINLMNENVIDIGKNNYSKKQLFKVTQIKFYLHTSIHKRISHDRSSVLFVLLLMEYKCLIHFPNLNALW